MGNMAFNDKTLRASNQTAWYPILFDAATGKVHDRYTYELTVHCPDCEALYLSGSEPARGQSATFKSAEPAHLLLFAGQFAFRESDPMFFINTNLPEASLTSLQARKDDIIAHYEELLQIPYGGDLTLVATSSTAVKPGFSFVSYPTIVFVGNNEGTWDIGNLFDAQTGQYKDQSIRFLAHEIAHYYVGTYFKPGGPLFWGFNEGLTEYLAARYLRQINRDDLHLAAIKQWMNQSAGMEHYVPIADVTEADQLAFDAYRYNFVPLLLTILEQEIGQDAMDQWVRLLLQRRSATVDLAFWRESVLELPVSPAVSPGGWAAVWADFEARFLRDPQSRDHALRYGESHFLPSSR